MGTFKLFHGLRTYVFPDRNITVAGTDDVSLKVDKAGDTMTGDLNTRSLFPVTGSTSDLGQGSRRYRVAYLNRIIANIIGPLSTSAADELTFINSAGVVNLRQFVSGNWNFGTLGSDPGFTMQVQGTANVTGQLTIPNGTTAASAVNLSQLNAVANNKPVRMLTGNTTITTADYYVALTSGNGTFTLPTGLTTNMEFVIKNKGTGVLTIGGTVDGIVNPQFNTQGSGLRVQWNGTAFDKTGSF